MAAPARRRVAAPGVGVVHAPRALEHTRRRPPGHDGRNGRAVRARPPPELRRCRNRVDLAADGVGVRWLAVVASLSNAVLLACASRRRSGCCAACPGTKRTSATNRVRPLARVPERQRPNARARASRGRTARSRSSPALMATSRSKVAGWRAMLRTDHAATGSSARASATAAPAGPSSAPAPRVARSGPAEARSPHLEVRRRPRCAASAPLSALVHAFAGYAIEEPALRRPRARGFLSRPAGIRAGRVLLRAGSSSSCASSGRRCASITDSNQAAKVPMNGTSPSRRVRMATFAERRRPGATYSS